MLFPPPYIWLMRTAFAPHAGCTQPTATQAVMRATTPLNARAMRVITVFLRIHCRLAAQAIPQVPSRNCPQGRGRQHSSGGRNTVMDGFRNMRNSAANLHVFCTACRPRRSIALRMPPGCRAASLCFDQSCAMPTARLPHAFPSRASRVRSIAPHHTTLHGFVFRCPPALGAPLRFAARSLSDNRISPPTPSTHRPPPLICR